MRVRVFGVQANLNNHHVGLVHVDQVCPVLDESHVGQQDALRSTSHFREDKCSGAQKQTCRNLLVVRQHELEPLQLADNVLVWHRLVGAAGTS